MPASSHPDLELASRIIRAHLAGQDVRVRLFGSRARGDARTWSDIDVAVEAATPLPRVFWQKIAACALRQLMPNAQRFLQLGNCFDKPRQVDRLDGHGWIV